MQDVTHKIRAYATELGFCALGITKQHTPEHYKHYLNWVNRGYHQNMWYLGEKTRKEKRADVRRLLPTAQSVLVGALSYHHNQPHTSNLKFARYGWGLDYHNFVKTKLKQLQTFMQEDLQLQFDAKIMVDTAPILEKDFAQQAGIGWIGKNTLIMNQKSGSYLYLGTLLTSLDLYEDRPAVSHCGSCTACIDACPTDAIEQPFVLNPAKCISYHTIENKNEDIPESIKPHLDGWVAGCDICQEVCPWNNKAEITTVPETRPQAHTLLDAKQVLKLSPTTYNKTFSQTAFSRIALGKLQQNVKALLEKAPRRKESIKKD